MIRRGGVLFAASPEQNRTEHVPLQNMTAHAKTVEPNADRRGHIAAELASRRR